MPELGKPRITQTLLRFGDLAVMSNWLMYFVGNY